MCIMESFSADFEVKYQFNMKVVIYDTFFGRLGVWCGGHVLASFRWTNHVEISPSDDHKSLGVLVTFS